MAGVSECRSVGVSEAPGLPVTSNQGDGGEPRHYTPARPHHPTPAPADICNADTDTEPFSIASTRRNHEGVCEGEGN